jgi:hypothetical protein
MAKHNRRAVNERALGKTVLASDHTPALLVRRIIERYVQECRNTVLETHERPRLLADLAVGESRPWPYGVQRIGRGVYLQGIDRKRGREVLGDADADWRIVVCGGGIRVKRTQ